ncbi:MAG: arginine repressor [Actinomycetota bacterium]|nr:arginine repressor [Actinomycetota bacterium]
MKRTERLRAIKEIISSKKISSQEDLLNELKKRGHDVTQSTISRDISELRLVKTRNYREEEYYSIENMTRESKIIDPVKFKTKLKESVLSVKRAENIIVLRTFPGEAQGTAAIIDGMNFVEIIGTVAGDDTIICIADNRKNAEKIFEMMQKQF